MSRPFRVLSLSGGGIRGVFTASVLCELERALATREGAGARLADYFDLIVGTSTGGLIGLGLAFGHPAFRMLDFYKTHGPVIFKPVGKRGVFSGRWLNRSAYDVEPLRAAVNQLLPPGTKLGHALRPVLLPAVLAKDGQPCCLKTQHNDDFYIDCEMEASEAGVATAAAPIVFPAVHTEARGHLLDGGLWANCPALVGAIEAVRFFGRDWSNVRVLSIGTGRKRFELPNEALNGGLYQYAVTHPMRVPELLFECQRATAMNAASLLLSKGALVEIDQVGAIGEIPLFDASPGSIAELERVGGTTARAHVRDILANFLAEPAPEWKPKRRPAGGFTAYSPCV